MPHRLRFLPTFILPVMALLCCAAASGTVPAAPSGNAWWVWLPGRMEALALTAGLTPRERLYWHTATLSWNGKTWQDTESPAPPPDTLPQNGGTGRSPGPGPDPDSSLPSSSSNPPPAAPASPADRPPIIPVLRLQGDGIVESDAAWPPVLARLREMAARQPSGWVQVDCDCPDRLLDHYAGRLAGLRRDLAPVKLSVTALAGWARVLRSAVWKEAADEFTPMFYDLEPDSPAEVLAGHFHPLVDESACRELMAAWGRSGLPWRAGLANFRRLSRFRADGSLAGHYPLWNWSALLDSESLSPAESPAPGCLLWRVRRGLPVTPDRAAAAGDFLVFRSPDLAALRRMEALALSSGAVGLIRFTRPCGRVTDGWSAAQLAAGSATPDPSATLMFSGSRLELKAGADGDWPPLARAGRGWRLELSAPADWLESSGPGEFVRLSRPGGGAGASAELSWIFPGLAAGQSLRTAPVRVKAGVDRRQFRWRVVEAGESGPDSPWKSLP